LLWIPIIGKSRGWLERLLHFRSLRTAILGGKPNAARSALSSIARERHGSLVMLGGGPGVGKTRWRWISWTTRGALASAASSASCYERDETLSIFLFVEIIESGLAHTREPRLLRQVLATNAAEWRKLGAETSKDIPRYSRNPLNAAGAEASLSVSGAFLRRWADGTNTPTVTRP